MNSGNDRVSAGVSPTPNPQPRTPDPAWGGRPLPAGEGKRKLVHAGMGLFALLLPLLTWPQAALCALGAFAFNWLILPRLLGHRLTSARAGVSDRGVLLYPLVVLALILLFRYDLSLAAFGWGVLAFGDAAAGIAGQKWGRHPLPWNRGKSWEGLVAFVVAGAAAGVALSEWVVRMQPKPFVGAGALAPPPHLLSFPQLILIPIVLAAMLESVPHGLDDNVLPAIAATFLLGVAPVYPCVPDAGTPPDWRAALVINTVCAAAALMTRSLRPSGVAVAWALGVVTWLAFGRAGFLLLAAFLVAGLLVTFVGYGRKHGRGVAEGGGGRRGGAEVFGKGGALLLLGLWALVLETGPWPYGTNFANWGWIVVAILAAATADTWATELGGLWGRRAFTLVPWREATPGTSGAVSVAGLLAAFAGAAAISIAGGALGLLGRLPLRFGVVCTVAAFVATAVESTLPLLGEASHVGKNLVVTLLAPILAFAVLGIWP